jgi:hypothetical protein
MSAYFSAFKTIGKVLKGNKSKVSPTIKSVKPSKNIKEFTKHKEDIAKSTEKFNKGLTEEGKINVRKSTSRVLGKISNILKRKQKREQKMGGGMMGRRMGYSQGKLAVTPREKQLAAQYGDKKRITRGDVITAAKKKSGEEPMRDRMKQPLKKKGT